jgi:hypothetical protein
MLADPRPDCDRAVVEDEALLVHAHQPPRRRRGRTKTLQTP